MVGGGPGAFIGPVHRMAAELDGRFRLVAGAFSREADKSAAAGRAWGLDPDRTYADYRMMIEAEAARPDGARVVVVATPNDTHLAVSSAALRTGLHVMSDKPATRDLAEALQLARIVRESGRLYGLTYVYTGYPMVREARGIVGRGELGAIRKVVVEYQQGWLSRPIEREGSRQAEWRADPARAGVGGCIGDIGVHAFNLAEFIAGDRVERLCADVSTLVPGRVLDDDANVLLRFAGGARGVLVASQVCAGARNGLRIEVFGEKGGLAWSHERPDRLTLDWLDTPTQVLHAAAPYLADPAAARIPTGHPEGFIEAFANLYRDFAAAIAEASPEPGLAPGIVEGVRGMAFVETAVSASREGRGWVDLTEEPI
ncbi:MAG: Gfo/Idh/MocA family oxidoreductase [Caulobacteraceae bacterium]|nr:Gfo/Idh/MocA family oxidoreductase [Caulobacteraceae bacterium]